MAKNNYKPKFDKRKYYAIGALQAGTSPTDTPLKFSNKPVPPLHISGADLIAGKMNTAPEFLQSSNCQFKVGKSVYFFEVDYENDGDLIYKLIYTGSPLLIPQTTLSDGKPQAIVDGRPINISQILPPVKEHSAENKEFIKSQGDQIKQLTEIGAKDRKEFANERNTFLLKINELNDKIVDLNIEINTLKADKNGLEARLEEKERFIEKLLQMQAELKNELKEELQNRSNDNDVSDEPMGLADKVGAMMNGIDAKMGDGASLSIATHLLGELGKGLNKLVDFGVDWARTKVAVPQVSVPPPITQAPQAPVTSEPQEQPELIYPQPDVSNDIEAVKEILNNK
ncbi:MAG: hypothetical protein LBO69_05545 [Ignavibacteria bacterium]|jgi:hypothetical protein|nr:hypothetical protein [Ignavibacteria bacterium]